MAVLTGAGVSAESGVPTFRDALTGLRAKFRPEELATPGAFRRNPRLVWEWYEWRRQLVAQARPNPAHIALGEMGQSFPHFSLITQNVDGLHQRSVGTNPDARLGLPASNGEQNPVSPGMTTQFGSQLVRESHS